MMKLLPKTNVDFLKYRKVFFLITAVIFIVGIGSLFTRGINFGVEFTGGTLVQVAFSQKTDISEVRNVLEKEGLRAEIQTFVGKDAFSIKIKGKQENVNEVKNKVEAALKTLNKPFELERNEYVGPAVGKDLSEKAVLALVLALTFMILYIWIRFSNIVWGTSGVLAIFHDVLVMVFAFSILQLEVDLVMVAALLTIAGYSINDNIVIFDRMREKLQENPKMKMYDVINTSINETLSRTFITSGTFLLAVIILYFMGGDALKNFALSMIIGGVAGVYSTIAIATPLVYQWGYRREGEINAEQNNSSSAHNNSSAQHKDNSVVSNYKKKKNKHHR